MAKEFAYSMAYPAVWIVCIQSRLFMCLYRVAVDLLQFFWLSFIILTLIFIFFLIYFSLFTATVRGSHSRHASPCTLLAAPAVVAKRGRTGDAPASLRRRCPMRPLRDDAL